MHIRIIWITAILVFLILVRAQAIDVPESTVSRVYSEHIKTVQMYRAGWVLSNPVMTLGTDEQLVFSFDDLSGKQRDYYYTFFHCDRNWKVSSMAQQEYFESFTEFPVNDFEYSVNTTVPYTNYMLRIPNEDAPIVFSGNYLLVVYDRDEPSVPIVTWRFYVVEPLVSVNARIRPAMFGSEGIDGQEVDFVVDCASFNMDNPASDVKVVVQQNNRTDNQSDDLKPLFMSNNVLEYDYNSSNVFPGVNEFRLFIFRDIRHPGRGVNQIEYNEPFYHVSLENNQPRSNTRYNYREDINGNYQVEIVNREYPETEADYLLVHFTLDMPQPLLGGGIYIFGKLSNWECSEAFKMRYNMDLKRYEHSLLLKQGVYNYMFAYRDDFSGQIKAYNIEGSHSETENDYRIFVYYGRITDRYDRLIGYNRFNSSTNRSY
ncbi:MAG: DUF5103 domain-containing protein [Prolixibacteraceae bacterium]|nr:DUF5103 domain-containing protein [Prolixibacteraceae bacterium]MBN2648627.1 DUF5103 domain-containing protein [Prolixibacteraceae bacterium]